MFLRDPALSPLAWYPLASAHFLISSSQSQLKLETRRGPHAILLNVLPSQWGNMSCSSGRAHAADCRAPRSVAAECKCNPSAAR